jgi:hypothetical protein
MKKTILFAFALSTLSAVAQTVGGSPGAGTQTDSTNNPAGQAFGGAMGGGPANVPNRPNPVPSPTSIPRGTEIPQERMEEPDTRLTPNGLINGSDIAPSAYPPSSTYPADTPVAPQVPPTGAELPRTNNRQIAPSGRGLGTDTL